MSSTQDDDIVIEDVDVPIGEEDNTDTIDDDQTLMSLADDITTTTISTSSKKQTSKLDWKIILLITIGVLGGLICIAYLLSLAFPKR